MSIDKGVFYGLGVGPGDPGLITVRATEILGTVPVVLAASSTKNDYSLALDVARPYLHPTTEVRFLAFPMTEFRPDLTPAWAANARLVLDVLDGGRDAAFITIGDPMTYSTYAYLLQAVQTLAPETKVVTVPGVTAYQAAAARLNLPLALGREALMIIPGINDEEQIKLLASEAENIVVLKAYRNFSRIGQALADLNLADRAVLISHCGLESERITRGLDQAGGENPPYLSLILVKKPASSD